MSEASPEVHGPDSSEDEGRHTRGTEIAQLPPAHTYQFPVYQGPNLTGFWQSHPREDLDGLSEAELKERIAWGEELTVNLERDLAEQTAQLKAEWAAKEHVLTQVLDKMLS